MEPAAVEIERKFLLDALPDDLDTVRADRIEQGYLAIGADGVEVRVRRRAGASTLTVKSAPGEQRVEEEIPIDDRRFASLWPLSEGRRITKTRHLVDLEPGLTAEVDVYDGALEGLLTVEVEFPSLAASAAFVPPAWIGREVTGDPRYANQSLALHGPPPGLVGFVQDGATGTADPGGMTKQQIDARLRDGVRGRVVLPDDAGWDEARRSWNLSVDQRPAAVVEAAGPEDVQAVLRAGLRVAPQSTGHGSEALPDLDGVVLLKTSRLRDVTVDGGVVRAGAGALAGDVAAAAGEHGLAPLLGLAATVGVTGLALGGGTGWLSRAHGLTCNSVRAFEVVLASGERLRVDAGHEPDLFWALRGGGGRFAVVTALELEAHPVPEVSAGMLAWPAERAAEVLEPFRRWAGEAPEALGAVFRYLALPDVEGVPAPLRGRRVVAVVAAYLGPDADGRRLLAPFPEGTLMDTFGPVGPADLVRVAGDPEQPMPARGDGFLVHELDVDAIAGLIDDVAPLSVLELRLLGGALGRAPQGHGALARLDAAFAVFAGGAAVDAPAAAAIAARLEAVRDRLAPWTAPQALLNASGGGVDPARAFDAATWERLSAVRDRFDPERRLVSAYA